METCSYTKFAIESVEAHFKFTFKFNGSTQTERLQVATTWQRLFKGVL